MEEVISPISARRWLAMKHRESSSGAMAPTTYRIVVRGELSRRYVPAFEGMTLAPGDGQTAIVGPVIDQAHLHGLLNRVVDLGLELVSVNPTLGPASSAPAGQMDPQSPREARQRWLGPRLSRPPRQ
jgi:hypothetical protein